MVRRTIELKPGVGEMIKPSELIELKGIGPLTLQDRRVFNLLIENAWGPKLGIPGHDFSISTADLKSETESNQRLVTTIERLMRVIVVAQQSDGSETRLQLLTTNNLKTTENRGVLTYCFPPKLAELLKESTIFAKLDLEVMKSFSSKYAFSLYEAISRRIRLQHIYTESLSIDEMRDLLGVDDGKLKDFKNLRIKAIEPALTEVNSITPYQVHIEPLKKGRKVIGFLMGWSVKDVEGMRKAYQELQRPRVGRKARLDGSELAPVSSAPE